MCGDFRPLGLGDRQHTGALATEHSNDKINYPTSAEGGQKWGTLEFSLAHSALPMRIHGFLFLPVPSDSSCLRQSMASSTSRALSRHPSRTLTKSSRKTLT